MINHPKRGFHRLCQFFETCYSRKISIKWNITKLNESTGENLTLKCNHSTISFGSNRRVFFVRLFFQKFGLLDSKPRTFLLLSYHIVNISLWKGNGSKWHITVRSLIFMFGERRALVWVYSTFSCSESLVLNNKLVFLFHLIQSANKMWHFH